MTESGPDSAYSLRFLDHLRSPRLQGALPPATHRGQAEDPACGDRLSLDLCVAVAVARLKVEMHSVLGHLLVGNPNEEQGWPLARIDKRLQIARFIVISQWRAERVRPERTQLIGIRAINGDVPDA